MTTNKQGVFSKKNIALVLMMLSLNTIYLLPYLMYTYYAPLQEAMGLVGQDAAFGRLLNIYGIANILLYIPGGWIADKFDAKRLLVFSMISTGALGLWESTWPSYTMLMLIYVGWAITTVLTYWSASIKCVNIIAGDEQGGTFGWLEAGRGIIGLLVTTVTVSLYGLFSASGNAAAMSGIVIFISVVMILVGIALALLMPKTSTEGSSNATLLDSFRALGVAFRRPVTYLLAGMIFSGSVTKAAFTYVAPYMEQVLEVPQKSTVFFSNYATMITGIVGASLAAVMATKMGRSSKPLVYAGIVMLAVFGGMSLLPQTTAVLWPVMILAVIGSLCTFVFRALYYAVIEEMGSPKNTVGSIIGIASIIGFIPDAFYTSMCGGWLEQYGPRGYRMIFISCCIAAAVGLCSAFISEKRICRFRAGRGK